MKMLFDNWDRLIKNKGFYHVVTIYLVVGIVSICTIVLFVQLGALYQSYTESEEESNRLAETVELIRNNKNLLGESIDAYNELFTQFIPQEESYFSVISALETLIRVSGVTLSTYNLNLEGTNDRKVSLDVQIEGTQDEIKTFLREYQYRGGRLITISHIQMVDVEKGKMFVTMNFYHNRSTKLVAGVTKKINPSDIEMVRKLYDQTAQYITPGR